MLLVTEVLTTSTRVGEHEVKYTKKPSPSSPSGWESAEPPLRVVVATAEERLQWAMLESFAAHSTVRVTACSTVGQCRQLCSSDSPGVVILDLDLLGDEPSALGCFASLMRPDSRLIGLTCGSTEAGGEWDGPARLVLVPKVVATEALVQLALSDRRGA